VEQLKLDLSGFKSAAAEEAEKTEKKRKAVKKAEKKKKEVTETMEEAWERVLNSKLTDSDRNKLLTVKKAMEDGKLGREPGKVGKAFTKAEGLRLYKYLMEMQREDVLKDMVRKMPSNYICVRDTLRFKQVIDDLKREAIIAVDTETTGLNVYVDKIVGFNFTLPQANYHVYIPIRHKEGEQLDSELVIKELKPILEDENVKKVLHNAKYDIHMMLGEGIEMNGLEWDTMIAMHVLNENEESYSLKNLATKYLKEPSGNFEKLFGKASFDTVALAYATVYGCKDTDLTWRLYQFQLKYYKKLPELFEVLKQVEMPTLEVSVEMERTGFVFDTNKAEELRKKLSGEISDLEAKLQAELGDINLNSPAQLSNVLFKKMQLHKHLPPGWKLSTDVKTLKMLKKHHVAVEWLLKYRELTKLLNTYINALPEQIQPDGRIHGTFNQMGTVTGRFSSNNPNLQNQPKYARKLFVAPEGSVILSADFSQQEPRLLAHFTGEPALVEAYRNGLDLYSFMASKVYNLPYEECGDGTIYRKRMKFGVLSVMYGTGATTLADQLGVTVAEAEQFIKDFFKTFPRVKAWIEHNKKMARTHGYIKMLMGRKRRLPDAKSNDYGTRARAERQATNARIQGSGAIQTKLTMIALWNWCKEKRKQGRNFWMLATVHDEVLIYAPADVTLQEVAEFENIMINAVKLKVPNKTDIEVQTRWGTGVKYDSKRNVWAPALCRKDNEKEVMNLGEYTDAMEAINALERALENNPEYKVA
jgi:DNA polymerase I